jgi:transposase
VKRRRKVELFEQIRREYEHGVGTIKGVARKLGVHRRMVREAIASAVPQARKTPVRERPKLGSVTEFIDGILEADRKAPRKQRHTAHRIWVRLRKEMPGVEVAECTVRRYVRQRKRAMGLSGGETFIPQSYSWGHEAQVDWYEAWADLSGERQKLFIFCMRAMASGGSFHQAYPHATQQAFLEAHESAFHHFGGTFAVLRYDNLSSAVKKILRGRQRQETERFIAFRSHWGFESDFCTPGRGNEKGGVEGEQGYFRRNHMVPLPQAPDLEHLNQLLRAATREEEQRVIAGRTQTVGAAMAIEREHLRPLAAEGFDLAAVSFPEVNSSSTVSVLTNFYSAPLPPGTPVAAKAYAAYVELWQEGRCVARHERCFGRQQKVLNLEHYLDALLKKPGALAGSMPLEQWRAQGRWPASFDHFWEKLQQRRGRQDGTRAMIEVLLLGRQYGYEPMRRAVEQALALGGSDVAVIRYLMEMERGEQRVPTAALEVGWLQQYERPQPHLQDYDRLLTAGAGEVIQ